MTDWLITNRLHWHLWWLHSLPFTCSPYLLLTDYCLSLYTSGCCCITSVCVCSFLILWNRKCYNITARWALYIFNDQLYSEFTIMAWKDTSIDKVTIIPKNCVYVFNKPWNENTAVLLSWYSNGVVFIEHSVFEIARPPLYMTFSGLAYVYSLCTHVNIWLLLYACALLCTKIKGFEGFYEISWRHHICWCTQTESWRRVSL